MKRQDLLALIETAAEQTHARNRLVSIASSYQPSEEYDRLIEIRESTPDRYDKIVTPSLRMSVGYYEVSKVAHAAVAKLEASSR